MSEFVRCQGCGGDPVREEYVGVDYSADPPADINRERVRCPRCGRVDHVDDWNTEQMDIRADKEFQLVVAMAGGRAASVAYDEGNVCWKQVAADARAILDAMYGEIKEGER